MHFPFIEMLPIGFPAGGVLWAAVGCCGLLWGALGCSGLLWAALGWAALGCSGLLWAALGGSELLCADFERSSVQRAIAQEDANALSGRNPHSVDQI